MDQGGAVHQQAVEFVGDAHIFHKGVGRHEAGAQGFHQIGMRPGDKIAAQLAIGHALPIKAGAAFLRRIRVQVQHAGIAAQCE